MNYKFFIGTALICAANIINSNNDNKTVEKFTLTPTKKISKITAENCCTQILHGMKFAARSEQYRGQLRSITLEYAQDFFEDTKDALFKIASPADLQELYHIFQELSALEEKYEHGLREVRDKIKHREQQILAPKKKK